MMRIMVSLAMLALAAEPGHASPPDDKPLPGERLNGHGQDERSGKRIENRVPTRLQTRITRRTIETPLAAATSKITADADNGCSRGSEANASQRCGQPQ